ncbi:hypothetical protein CDEF62S_01575 [Castellaniella defragrans]
MQVAVIGTGLIGQAWAIVFARAGYGAMTAGSLP